MIRQVFLNLKVKMSLMDLVAEREGFQHRIKSLEVQVLNLEQLIEDVEKENSSKEQNLGTNKVSSFFANSGGPSFSTNNSNNVNFFSENSEESPDVIDDLENIENPPTNEPTTASLFPPEDQVLYIP